MTEHIDEAMALALVALDEHDPQRRAAVAHADHCQECASLLEQSAELLSMIDGAGQLPVVSRELKARVERAVFEPPAKRAPWMWGILALLGLSSLVLALLEGHFGEPLSGELGLRCLAYETGLGLAPLPLAALLHRTGTIRLQPLQLVSITTSLALLGQLLLRTRCEAQGAGAHLLAFHVGGVLLAALLGMAGEHLIRTRFASKV
jgi:hypothetical protein